jgi:hypothetical protein
LNVSEVPCSDTAEAQKKVYQNLPAQQQTNPVDKFCKLSPQQKTCNIEQQPESSRTLGSQPFMPAKSILSCYYKSPTEHY